MEDIRAMLKSYTEHLPRPVYTKDGKASERIVVLLTGSTGSVGSHVLAALLAEPKVEKVYVLNRNSEVAKLEEAFLERGLPLELLDKKEKLVPLKGDVTQERLGLGEGVFNEVRNFFLSFVT